MKLLVVILDGIGDESHEILGGKTPLEFSNTPYLDSIKNSGSFGFLNTEKEGYPIESSSCILNIIGAEEKAFTLGRSFFEAKAKDISIENDESVLRLNIVTTDEKGSLTSFNGQGLSQNELAEIFESLNKKYKNIHYLSGYKGILITKTEWLKNSPLKLAPHENVGENYDSLVNENIGDNSLLDKFLSEINTFLESYNKKNICYKAYFYSKEKETGIKSFSDIYGKDAGFVGFTEIAVGIAKTMKMHTVVPENTTGDSDTNLLNKAICSKKLLKKHNICFVHINGCDEISHRKNLWEKISFIEKIDEEFFGEILKEDDKNRKILVLCDHITSSKTGMHKKGAVPFITNMKNFDDLTTSKIHETLRKFV